MGKRTLTWGAALVIALCATAASAEDEAKPTKQATQAKKPAVPDAIRLRQLERNVQQLKSRAVTANIAAQALKARALEGRGITTLKVRHLDRVPGSFRLERLVYYLDGKRIFVANNDDGELHRRKTIDVYFQSVPPGAHVLAVEARYRGHGYSVFRYLNKYRFRHRATHTFTARATKKTRIDVRSLDRGTSFPMRQRVYLRFRESR